jgi:hypothetical protein
VSAKVLPIGPGEANLAVTPVPETVLEADNVVNAPVSAKVLPIGPGVANRAVTPAPETVLEADNVVNSPAPINVPL